MSEGQFTVNIPMGSSVSVVFAGGPTSKVAMTLPDISAGFEVVSVCDRCNGPVSTDRWAQPADLPISRTGSWRHSCGGTGRMPDEYEVGDQRTGRRLDAYNPAPRGAIVLSSITLAELLRLSQAARAVERGRSGAEERLDRILAEAPEPIRRLRDRWTREQKLSLAGVIIALVALLMPLLKNDGAVTEQQLFQIVEQLIDQQQSDGSGQQAEPKDGAASGAGESGAGESGGAADTLRSGGDGSAPQVKREKGVGDPDQ